jgi:hypothetical protein
MCAFLLLHSGGFAYSVLTHEAIIDSVWEDSLKPLLLQHFPDSTSDELLEARSYAYGGSLIEDMGYYPFGSRMFSDLIHYVRTGEFIESLIRESRNLNEYAFALGTLSHYSSDSTGHSLATNRAVPILFPKLLKKHGSIITYDEKPSAHIRTEFGFDVLQVASGNYLPESYHDFIGFNVSEEVLERAFPDVYGLELADVIQNFDMAKGTFRFAIRDLIPEMTKVAWESKEDEIQKLRPGIKKAEFMYFMPRKDFEQQWGKEYKGPGLCARILAFFIKIVPKIGPLKALAVKVPTPEVEKMFLESFATTVTRYEGLLKRVKSNSLQLENRNLDTGEATKFGTYQLADKTYAKLVEKLAENQFEGLTPELRKNILRFFSNKEAIQITYKDSDDWKELLQHLEALESVEISSIDPEQQNEFHFNHHSCLQ